MSYHVKQKMPKKEKKYIFLLFFMADNDNIMGRKGIEGKIRSLRFPVWMYEALEEMALRKKSTFTDIVLELLRQELAVEGYSMGIGREAADMETLGGVAVHKQAK
jgi:hypothetical protein